MKIIQIDGIKGLISAVFIGACLFAGFVIFPGYVAMHLWNLYLVNLLAFPVLDLLQGVLVWAMIATSFAILSKNGLAISFKNSPELSDDELNSIIKSAKVSSQMKMMNKFMNKADKFEKKHKDIKPNLEDKETSFVSSPISSNKQINSEKSEEDSISQVK